MPVIPCILANPDADDPIDDDEVSHKHCNRIPLSYICTYIHLTCHQESGKSDFWKKLEMCCVFDWLIVDNQKSGKSDF